MQSPVPWPKLCCWAITPKHTVLHLIRLDTVTQPNNTAILEYFALHYIDLATLLTHTPYPYPYPYTRNIIQYNQYKSAGHTSTMRYSHARGLTAYSYTIQCKNTQEKDEINYNSPKKRELSDLARSQRN